MVSKPKHVRIYYLLVLTVSSSAAEHDEEMWDGFNQNQFNMNIRNWNEKMFWN